MRRTRLILPLITMGISASVHSVAEVPFNGKSGLSLRNALYESYRPSRQWNLAEYSATIFDPFNGRYIQVVSGKLPDVYNWGTIVPDVWWEYSPEIREKVASDFYNLIPLDQYVRQYRDDMIPGMVTDMVYENDFWSAGRGSIYGIATDLYSPPVSMRGELARTFFYIAIMYPSNIWTPRGFMMMDTNSYPVFNSYAAALLMEWHKSYPVSDSEHLKNEIGEKLQGNCNPFVVYPDLPDYLWGDKSGENFVVDGEPVALRSRYSMTDERIDLISPYIPSDAVWYVDDILAHSTKYKPSDLGRGEHDLKYHSASTGEKGYLRIVIE